MVFFRHPTLLFEGESFTACWTRLYHEDADAVIVSAKGKIVHGFATSSCARPLLGNLQAITPSSTVASASFLNASPVSWSRTRQLPLPRAARLRRLCRKRPKTAEISELKAPTERLAGALADVDETHQHCH